MTHCVLLSVKFVYVSLCESDDDLVKYFFVNCCYCNRLFGQLLHQYYIAVNKQCCVKVNTLVIIRM